jgi:hypothetical protein
LEIVIKGGGETALKKQSFLDEIATIKLNTGAKISAVLTSDDEGLVLRRKIAQSWKGSSLA